MKLLSRDRDKIMAVIAATLLICVFIVAVVRDGSGDAVSLKRPGSRGSVVYEVQRRLGTGAITATRRTGYSARRQCTPCKPSRSGTASRPTASLGRRRRPNWA